MQFGANGESLRNAPQTGVGDAAISLESPKISVPFSNGQRARRGCMDAGECIVPDGAYHAKRRNEHVYQRAVFRFADRYLPRLPLFPLFITCPTYDTMVSDSVVVGFRVEALRAGIHHHQPWLVGK